MLIHVDTEQGGEKLVNRRLAYVAVSRGRYDAQIYNDGNLRAPGHGSTDGLDSLDNGIVCVTIRYGRSTRIP